MKRHKKKNPKQKIRGALIVVFFVVLIAVETYFAIIEPLRNGVNFQTSPSQFWSLAIPVYAMVTIMSGISAWIGYTMFRTPEPIKLTYEEAYEIALVDQEESD